MTAAVFPAIPDAYFIMDCGDDNGNAQNRCGKAVKERDFSIGVSGNCHAGKLYCCFFQRQREAEGKEDYFLLAEKELEEAVQIICRGGFFPEKRSH